jgi:NAD(P)-dependent dehydrogenase (short-subunit alcohol dehydrogenase family)
MRPTDPVTPEEIGAVVVWLCSNEASFVLGNAMVVDDGRAT